MCIFSAEEQEAVRVATTNIFARIRDGRQLLVYSMRLDAPREVAMILPVPMAVGAGEDSFRFVDLTRWSRFFEILEQCFPEPLSFSAEPMSSTLAVHRVGSYEASFVPSLADFHRIDPRFRLSQEVWQQLPMYRDWSFAVFRLSPGAQDVHPMAFEFPSRVPGAVYFPTVHVHDGTVHSTANFLHKLYLQGLTRTRYLTEVLGFTQPDWRWKTTAPPYAEDAPRPLRTWITDRLATALAKIVDVDAQLLRLDVYGSQPNADIWLAEAPSESSQTISAEPHDGVWLSLPGVRCSRTGTAVGRLLLTDRGLSFVSATGAGRSKSGASWLDVALVDDDEHRPAEVPDAFEVFRADMASFDIVSRPTALGQTLLTIVLTGGDVLRFGLPDAPLVPVKDWAARIELPSDV